MAQWVQNPPAMKETREAQVRFLVLGRYPGGRNGDPLHSSCLKNLMDRGACWAVVHGVAKSWAQLSD